MGEIGDAVAYVCRCGARTIHAPGRSAREAGGTLCLACIERRFTAVQLSTVLRVLNYREQLLDARAARSTRATQPVVDGLAQLADELAAACPPGPNRGKRKKK